MLCEGDLHVRTAAAHAYTELQRVTIFWHLVRKHIRNAVSMDFILMR